MSERVKVLVVDDDVVSRMMLMHLVATCGHYEILEAEDGAHAWRQLQAGLSPAIVFCDLRMPHLSGMELLGRLKGDAQFASLPFVLASAASECETVDQARILGAAGYLVKPFRLDEVRALLAMLPGAREAADEAPAVTARRLGIDANRLLLYLGGLRKQLSDAGPAIERMLACGDIDAARARVARLREGCATLGLASAVTGLAALHNQPSFSAWDADEALAAAREAAALQSEMARLLASE
jgi:two-component system, chemotaxis family, chemotaxis protein CheY